MMFLKTPFPWIKSCVLALLAVLLHGHAVASDIRIGISMNNPFTLPFSHALSKDYFKKAKLDITFVDCKSGASCMKMLNDGSVDLIASSEFPIVFSAFEKNDLAIISTFSTARRHMGIVSKAANEKNKEKLTALTYGYTPKSASQYYLDLYFLYLGLKRESVKLKPFRADELPAALATSQIDVMAGWEPYNQQAVRSEPKAARVKTPLLYTLHYILVGSGTFAKTHSDLIIRLLQPLDLAIKELNTQPELRRKLLEEQFPGAPAYLDRIMNGYSYELAIQPTLSLTMDSVAKWAQREGHITSELPVPDFGKLIKPQFLASLKK